jgi:hypothetical protein
MPVGWQTAKTAKSRHTPPGEIGIIGDFGEAGQPEADVGNLVKSWAPEFIATVGCSLLKSWRAGGVSPLI